MTRSGWIEVIGLSALLVSVGLLVWELQQSNSLARAEVHRGITELNNSINLEIATDQEFAAYLDRLSNTESDLSGADLERAKAIALFLRNVWISSERAYKEGWIDRDHYTTVKTDVKETLSDWPFLKKPIRDYAISFSKGREITEIDRYILELTNAS